MIDDRLHAAGEIAVGGVLFSAHWWSPMLDQVVTGAHVITALCGAVIGIHGVIRIFKSWMRG